MTIINAVRMRPALYDTNLPIDERSKPKRKILWNQVAEIVNGNCLWFFDILKKTN